MNRILKISLISVITLPLLALAVLVIFIQFQDANIYKKSIEEQAKKRVGLNLSIDGSLAWSIFPLGIDINEIKIDDQDGKAFASVEQILAQVDLFSLLKASPSIHTLRLDSAKLNLVEDKQGQANWQNILPQKTTPPHQTNEAETEAGNEQIETATQDKTAKSELSFLLSKLELSNLVLNYQSHANNQKLELSPLNLSISDIAPEKDFPVALSFTLEDSIQHILLETKLTGLMNFSADFTQINLKELNSTIEASGAFSQSRKLQASIDSQLSVNTATQHISIPKLAILFEQLKIKSRVTIENYSTDLQVVGDFQLENLKPKELAKKFGVQLPELSSPDSLENIALKSALELKQKRLRLSNLEILMDSSNWHGNVNFNTLNQALQLDLAGDTLNIDHYLPIEKGNKNTEQNVKETVARPTKESASQILPLEQLRHLDFDIHFKQKNLIIKKALIENIDIQTTAKNGIIELKNLSANSYNGMLTSSAKLNTQNDRPSWKAESNISGLNLSALIQALEIQKPEETTTISGNLNFKTTLSAEGNTASELMKSAINHASFDIDNGALHGINLKALNCQGLAIINRESINTSDWGQTTPFDIIKGQANLAKETMQTRFDIVSSGLRVDAEGPINLGEQSLDFRLAMNVTGDVENQACRVNEKFKNIPIPVRCKGKFDTPPKELCKLDSVRLREAAKKAAVQEGKRKLEKELNRSLEKHLGEKADIKDAAKGLLKKLF